MRQMHILLNHIQTRVLAETTPLIETSSPIETKPPAETMPPLDLAEATPKEVAEWVTKLANQFLGFLKLLAIAVVVIVLGRKLIKWLTKIVHRSLDKSNLDEGVTKFLISAMGISLNVILVIIAASIVGLETGSLVALVGSAGLALGLALQGSLSNFAGGILILIMKPFRMGDYIIASGNEGNVTTMDIFYTKLTTPDNRIIVIPNGTLSNSNIVNVTSEPVRRLDLTISIDYSENIKKVKDILLQLANQNDMVLKEEYESSVFVGSFDPSAISIGLRVWVATDNYWALKWELLERIKETFDKEGVQIPFDQLDVNLNSKSIN